jgi:O-methyltransferase involved in polyketide biosynthesis
MNQMATVSGDILEGVSATTLWTLHNRGTEAKPSDGVIRDPWAVTLFDAISYDYRKFGRPNQAHPLRVLAFDAATRDYLATHPKASVVALAEGLQASFWRLDRMGAADELTWYSVDLPPVMTLREKLLPATTGSLSWPNRRLTAVGWIRSNPNTACSSPPRDC